MLFLVIVSAQEKSEEAQPKRKGAIKGKINTDDGQPIEGANVNVNAAHASGLGGWRQLQTDDEGNFVADELAPGLYTVSVGSNAYVIPERSFLPEYYRLGDVLNFTLSKGGVITGRVTNALGEAVIAAPIRVERVTDLEGRKTISEWWYGQQRKTDDRGVYRVYGLPAGRYIVSVGGTAQYRTGPPNSYESSIPTFYPSATRAGATEVTVNVSEEVRGIDIRYRTEKGQTISGKITGVPVENSTNGVQIYLYRYPGNGLELTTFVLPTDPTQSFEFYTVPEGEYELEASVYGGEKKDSYKSLRKRITVKSGNLTGIVLPLVALGSVEAKIEWEITPEKERKAECQATRPPLPEETMIWFVKDDPKVGGGVSLDSSRRYALPNEKAELKYQMLEAGVYRFAPRLLDESWYVKAVAAKSNSVAQSSSAKAETTRTLDLSKQGVELKSGDKRKDILLTLTNGAASLSGRVVAEKSQALPSRMRVHLIPAEKEAADDLLRYAEQKTKDGNFTFRNLAPGKYWLVVRKVADDESDPQHVNPLAWDSIARKALRREAELTNKAIDLTPCQREKTFNLIFGAAVK